MANELFILLMGLGWIFFGAAALLIGMSCYRKMTVQKSADYKKYLTHMYVAAKIRSLATRDNLNLVEEEKNYLEYKSLSEKDLINSLDEKIENDLMDRVTEGDKVKKKGE